MILEQLERDVEILLKHNLMDYSLLFCIELNPNYKKHAGPSTASSMITEDNKRKIKGKNLNK